MSDTPRTDGARLIWNLSQRELLEALDANDLGHMGDNQINGKLVTAEFARTLERELTARTQEVERLREELKKYRNPLEVLGDQRVTVGLGPDGPFVSEVKSTKGET